MRRALLWTPLALFVLVFAVVASGLMRPADRTVHSAMIGKPLPDFALPALVPGKPGLSSATFHQGKPRLLNIFASWCIPCIAEAQQLIQLKAMGVPIDGIAPRDTGPAVAAFLRRNGDPYERVGDDRPGKVWLSLGSSGVPETFVIDSKGVIVMQHIGEIRPENIDELAAALKNAR